MKSEFYRMVVRLAILYDSECWVFKKTHTIAKVRTLAWMSSITRKDQLKNEFI